MKKRGRTIQSNVQASVADVLAARMEDGELDAAATPLLGLDRVQEFRSSLDLPGYRDNHFLDHLDSIFARILKPVKVATVITVAFTLANFIIFCNFRVLAISTYVVYKVVGCKI